MAVIPWLLTRLGQSGLQAMATRTDEGHAWQRFLNMISRRKLAIVSVSLVIVLLTLFGLSRLRARVEVDGLFADDAPVIQSLRDLERRLGALDQIELLFVFEDCQPSDFYRRVDYIRGMQIALTEDTAFKQAYSLANYLPSRPRLRSGGRSITEQTLYRRLLGEQRENLGNSSFLKINEAQEVWRVMLRIPFTAQADFDDLRSDVLDVAEKYNQNYQQFDPDLKTVLPIYTGKLFLYNSAQKELLYDLFLNFLLAFVIITPLMIVVLRSLSMGLIAMIPNVMPMLIVFGGMGLIDLPVDIAIAMTASVALGIAVDDTAHFLIRFREFGGRLFQLSPAMEKTIDQCGPAMLYTTLMSGAGIFVSYFSQLQVVSRFAATLTLLLFIALLADVVLLPAILFVLGRGARNSQIPGPLAGVSFPPSVDDVERS
jgi:predicted RND superfamily exporter protein